MTDEEYFETQKQLSLLGGIVSGLPLRAFLDRIHLAEAAGPIINPTLYRRGQEQLQRVKALAFAALQLQIEVERQRRESRAATK